MFHRLSLLLTIVFILLTCCAHAQNSTFKTGEFVVAKTANEILGQEHAKNYTQFINPDLEITWEINIPANYDPAYPPGILVYISPQNKIKLPSGWIDVTEDKNLIFIAARKSGNKEPVSKRFAMALLALPLLQATYAINTDRIYISGFSGGGRVASMVSTSYPQIFKGALYNCGVNFWQDINSEQLETIKENRFVFLTGTNDFNLIDTKKVYSKYKKAGVINAKLMIVSNMGHSNPRRQKFSQAIEYLDAIKQ